LIRRALGFSVAEMADQLGLKGDKGAAQVREMEQDKQSRGAVARLVTYLLTAVELEVGAYEGTRMQQLLPRF